MLMAAVFLLLEAEVMSIMTGKRPEGFEIPGSSAFQAELSSTMVSRLCKQTSPFECAMYRVCACAGAEPGRTSAGVCQVPFEAGSSKGAFTGLLEISARCSLRNSCATGRGQ
ncbi:unnamed protein product [Symbiodinium sp. CCMP2592]|nr:unnamed protein product [Symbiodinium sp. CCMP2592]